MTDPRGKDMTQRDVRRDVAHAIRRFDECRRSGPLCGVEYMRGEMRIRVRGYDQPEVDPREGRLDGHRRAVHGICPAECVVGLVEQEVGSFMGCEPAEVTVYRPVCSTRVMVADALPAPMITSRPS